MVFKRRDRRPIWQVVLNLLWPRGGWARAFEYVKHRLRRLPDTPEKVARGVWAGVFTAFTPFYGFHFIIAALIAKLMRGNILAALMGTFFGNPLTYVPIGVAALGTGHWMLGTHPGEGVGLGRSFTDAGTDLWHNFAAFFTAERMDWSGIRAFYREVFYPYLIGGVIPGVVCATISYYIAAWTIAAHQNRRRKALRAKLEKLK